ncbi:sigma-70 family RNA polymerase sigma factor [Planctomycetota bacterium]|nr:sigma-70 family RNA polymerase sigma factor [Planctomycetota bacterium]
MEQSLDLTTLMQAHQTGIWRFLRALGADVTLADDLTQEVFLSVLRKPFEQRSETSTRAYLRTVARNLLYKARRNAGREVGMEELETLEAKFDELVKDDGSDLQAALLECLKQLEAKPREALDLQYRDNLQRQQIATKLDMTDDGVKTLLRRTKARLKKCVELRTKKETGNE